VGENYEGATISNSYAIGSVVGTGNLVGGLLGSEDGVTSNSFWDTQTSGQTYSAGGEGKTTAQMKDIATFAAWGNANIVQDASLSDVRPQLRWATSGLTAGASIWVIGAPSLTTLSYTLGNLGGTGSLAYTGNNYLLSSYWTSSSIFGDSNSGLTLGSDYQFVYNAAPVTGFSNAATYSNISVAFLNSSYAIAGTGNTVGNLTIAPKTVMVSGLAASNKVYDAGTSVAISNWGAISTGIAGQALTLNHGTASFADANAATGKTVTATGYSLVDGTGLASNYQLASTSATTTADISKADLTDRKSVV
jgi:hypothetical protein